MTKGKNVNVVCHVQDDADTTVDTKGKTEAEVYAEKSKKENTKHISFQFIVGENTQEQIQYVKETLGIKEIRYVQNVFENGEGGYQVTDVIANSLATRNKIKKGSIISQTIHRSGHTNCGSVNLRSDLNINTFATGIAAVTGGPEEETPLTVTLKVKNPGQDGDNNMDSRDLNWKIIRYRMTPNGSGLGLGFVVTGTKLYSYPTVEKVDANTDAYGAGLRARGKMEWLDRPMMKGDVRTQIIYMAVEDNNGEKIGSYIVHAGNVSSFPITLSNFAEKPEGKFLKGILKKSEINKDDGEVLGFLKPSLATKFNVNLRGKKTAKAVEDMNEKIKQTLNKGGGIVTLIVTGDNLENITCIKNVDSCKDTVAAPAAAAVSGTNAPALAAAPVKTPPNVTGSRSQANMGNQKDAPNKDVVQNDLKVLAKAKKERDKIQPKTDKLPHTPPQTDKTPTRYQNTFRSGNNPGYAAGGMKISRKLMRKRASKLGRRHKGTRRKGTRHKGTRHKGTRHKRTRHKRTRHKRTRHKGTRHKRTRHKGTRRN